MIWITKVLTSFGIQKGALTMLSRIILAGLFRHPYRFPNFQCQCSPVSVPAEHRQTNNDAFCILYGHFPAPVKKCRTSLRCLISLESSTSVITGFFYPNHFLLKFDETMIFLLCFCYILALYKNY